MSESADLDGLVSYRYLNARLDAINARIISGESQDRALGDSITGAEQQVHELGRSTDRRCKAAETRVDAVRNEMQAQVNLVQARLTWAIKAISCLALALVLVVLAALL